MKIIAFTDLIKKIFDDEKSACEFFEINENELKDLIKSGKSVAKGCRYFQLDEYLEPKKESD